jgi:hypothetical protein
MERISQFICEWIATSEKGKLPPAEIDRRVHALRETFRSAHDIGPMAFQEAMTTQHFALYFGDALSRMFLKDYEAQTGAWRNYTYADTSPDFRPVNRFRMNRTATLRLRREKGEAKAGDVQEARQQMFVDEYAVQIDLSWQTLQNDDLGELRKIPQGLAQDAAEFEDGFVSALYDNATTQATLAALGLPWAFTGRLTVANLAIAVSAMSTRTKPNGNPLNIRKVYLVIPPVLKIQAAQILQDILGYGGPNSNVLQQFLAGYYVDPYITLNPLAPADVPWYLFADPQEIPAVTVLRLQGTNGPWTYTRLSDTKVISGNAPAAFMLGSFATGDIEYAVEDIIGGWNSGTLVGVTDPRGIFYSSGTTA